ncbi:SpvB/TcaC N-terminal domain-containing protein [Pseudomonas sp. CFBP 13602]|uniref:SpvB/TcaC N-terminal domain-containing protein n=1 Tax=Pseudomonas sp. CFBP 13602 TaxID=2774039 RepID=UPI00178735B7|nr:SpvB/TcaC N-terminal domain-containing protein [Pseudomonas sp. CFBP 13602]MBD8828264.1 toxin [Pseudomonas sp. CFBP 13602]
MNTHHDTPLAINTPSLPKGGGAIQSIGKGWGSVGASGAASFSIALPFSPGRGATPQLGLSYSSGAGNGPCGMGWGLSRQSIARRTQKGVPAYTVDDEMVGPGGDVLLPQRDAQGVIVSTTVHTFRGQALGASYRVTRHCPRVEGSFARIEHWQLDDADAGFWLVHGSDGGLHLYGKRASARVFPAHAPQQVGEWLLEESVTPTGDHVVYEYRAEDGVGLPEGDERDHSAQRYLSRVRYGNFTAHAPLYLWDEASLPEHWHFDLVLDYGERAIEQGSVPTYAASQPWPLRPDPIANFAYGFELRSLRRCHQVLMFHRFDELGSAPVLVNRLWLEYRQCHGYSLLTAAIAQACEGTEMVEQPPLEFRYEHFRFEDARYREFEAMPGLDDGQTYQLVDLYGEGLPGVLYRQDDSWRYREPVRGDDSADPDAVAYAPWQQLPRQPVADARKPARQFLSDLTGDGRLDWIVAQPGYSGFFTLGNDRAWSGFHPFDAFPLEFFSAEGQMTDLVGDGLRDFAMIGSRSVRLYPSARDKGFALPRDVAHADDALPLASNSQHELVAFSDVLGSGQQHLIRIRHDELRCWPNLGRGMFGKSFKMASLPFAFGEFDASRVRLADLDGSGAADLIYLNSEHAQVFLNQSGNGFAEPVLQAWPQGLRYDNTWQVSVADLQGLGCSSLVLSVPHLPGQHWQLDFNSGRKPYLLVGSNNNMGADTQACYRSSAQEWLDEKAEQLAAGLTPVAELPFPVHVVMGQTQHDEITGNTLSQRVQYRRGHYDGREREMRGFGLVIATDSEAPSASAEPTSPVLLTKTWYHTGRAVDEVLHGTVEHDPQARTLGPILLLRHDAQTGNDSIVTEQDEGLRHDMACALSGQVLRTEVFGLDGQACAAVPYSVQVQRPALRLLQPRSAGQRYATLLPMTLETLSYQYERIADDPQCSHSVQLRADAFGAVTHAVSIAYARRKHEIDTPPYSDEHEQTWWRDAFDPAQHRYYFSESRTQSIHLADDPQYWRLHLPYRARGNAWSLPKAEVTLDQLGYEALLRDDGLLGNTAPRTLTALSMQRYQGCSDGSASFLALADFAEAAELDEAALQAYAEVLEPQALDAKLVELGYQPMPAFLPEEPDRVLWSVRQGYATYGDAQAFYKVQAYRQSPAMGETRVQYDAYQLLPVKVIAADGCTTQARYDYRHLQPVDVVDPNNNRQQASYDAFGRLSLSSFFGTEMGEPVGFAPLQGQTMAGSIAEAIADDAAGLGDWAMAYIHEGDAWMGEVPAVGVTDSYALGEQVMAGRVTLSGQLRASARKGWQQGLLADAVAETLAPLASYPRQPVRVAAFQADRYPGDPERQVRMSIESFDGFGRNLQSKQRVEPGMAHQVDGDGMLLAEDAHADPRWRVSQRVEYDTKGQVIRVYRPYFANSDRYIDDASHRDAEHSYHDLQRYDALGRPTETWTAAGWLRRQRHTPWYSISEDENDTAEEVLAMRAAEA